MTAEYLGTVQDRALLGVLIEIPQVGKVRLGMPVHIFGGFPDRGIEPDEKYPLGAECAQENHAIKDAPCRKRDQREAAAPDHDPARQHPALLQVRQKRLGKEGESDRLADFERQGDLGNRADLGIEIQEVQS